MSIESPEPRPAGASERKLVRAAEYRRLSEAAQALADSSELAHVREKHEQAAQKWASLAEMDEQPTELQPTASRPA